MGVWPWVLEIERTVSDVGATGRGRLLLIRSEPGLGRSRLLIDAPSRLAQRRPLPAMMAGGFDVAGARGDFTASPLPRTIRTDASLTALGHAFSTAGAAVAVADPTGAVKAAGCHRSPVRRVGVGRRVPDETRADGRPIPGSGRAVATLRDRLRGGRMLVMALSDIDPALLPVRWCDFFLLWSFPPLHSSRLVVIATASPSGPLSADAGTEAVIEEIASAGIATTLIIGRYGVREVNASLGEADDELVEDLIALSGGDGERIAELFRRWTQAGVAARRDGRWTYAIGREAARQTAGDEVRAQLRRAFEHLADETAVKGYDLAVRTLRVAAGRPRVRRWDRRFALPVRIS